MRHPLQDAFAAESERGDDIDGRIEGQLAGPDALEGVHDGGEGTPVHHGGVAIAAALPFQPFRQGQLLIPAEERDGPHLPQIQAQGVVGSVGVLTLGFGWGGRLFRGSVFGIVVFFRERIVGHLTPGGFAARGILLRPRRRMRLGQGQRGIGSRTFTCSLGCSSHDHGVCPVYAVPFPVVRRGCKKRWPPVPSWAPTAQGST
jgi:hypothetical protein